MSTVDELFNRQGTFEALREKLVDELGPQLIEHPELAEALMRDLDNRLESLYEHDLQAPAPPDSGLGHLIGLGPDAPRTLGQVPQPSAVASYDDEVTAERILAVADLYYIYQHERVGIFRAVLKLQELFNAGTVRLSSGPGAYGLYRFDRRQVLRYTQLERQQAYRRVFGYTQAPPAPGAQPNHDFHPLFIHFVSEVAEFFRDKRVSEVIRPRASDPSFGSIAVVRRAGLDLRNNVKHASFGHVVVLRVEVMQLLDEAFRILAEPDILKLFGAENAWDVIEEVMRQYLNQPQVYASSRNRMAVAGRDILRWLGQPHILNTTRAEFEALLLDIGDRAEEWMTSAESLGSSYRRPKGDGGPRVLRSRAAAQRPVIEGRATYLDR